MGVRGGRTRAAAGSCRGSGARARQAAALALALLVTCCSTAVPAAGPAPSAPDGEHPPRTFTVAMSGDVLLHDTLWEQARRDAARTGRDAYDFRPMLRGMRSAISGVDLAVCHIETPLAAPDGPFSDYPLFDVPPQIARDLAWLGYDTCTTASNHTLDQGFSGVTRTLDTLDDAGIGHTGSARTPDEAERPLVRDVAGVRVGLVAATYGTNGMPVPEGRRWSLDLIDADRIIADARAARQAGAEVVIAALHWGEEYRSDATREQRALARTLASSPDVDLVYGHHAHVVQPFDRVAGEWIAYGLGNAVADQLLEPPGMHEGITARFTFRETRPGSFEVTHAAYVPTYVTDDYPIRWLNIAQALRGSGPPPVSRGQLRAAADRIADVVGRYGAADHGLRPTG
ncbi:MAG: CapA family protein [Carbonactinosporaceae bacterium]